MIGLGTIHRKLRLRGVDFYFRRDAQSEQRLAFENVGNRMKAAQHDALAAFDFTLVEMRFGERVLNGTVV